MIDAKDLRCNKLNKEYHTRDLALAYILLTVDPYMKGIIRAIRCPIKGVEDIEKTV